MRMPWGMADAFLPPSSGTEIERNGSGPQQQLQNDADGHGLHDESEFCWRCQACGSSCSLAE